MIGRSPCAIRTGWSFLPVHATNVISAIFVLLNFVVDLLYAVIDPRVRHG